MNPGSKEAVKAGCTCPVIDNNFGQGAYVTREGNKAYWYDKECTIHGKSQDVDANTILFKMEV